MKEQEIPANLYQYLAAVCTLEEPDTARGWFVHQFPKRERDKAQADLGKFLASVDDAGLTGDLMENWPFDLYLTRNRHGAGFWDGGYPDEIGRKLTDIAHGLGEVWAYKAHGRIYFC